ncbi:MAG: hypothetical protein ACI3ZN_04815 [Candidatus Cryptobacteroides sp.]
MDDYMKSVLERFDNITDTLAHPSNSYLTYLDICRMLDVDPEVLDDCLREELGSDGNTVVEVCRRHLPLVFF